MSRKIELSGKRFGKLLVLKENGRNKSGKPMWDCVCDCGSKVNKTGASLISNQTKSCGCLQKEMASKAHIKHGMSKIKSPEYYAWVNIKTRCYNTKLPDFKDYGGRGIKVCDRWLESFENFYQDMGKRPSNKHSIDRYPNNDGNYEPSNCRWGTNIEQANNKRNIVLYESNGLIMNLQGWANYFGVHQANLMQSLKSKGIDKCYDFYYKKYNGIFPNGEKVKNNKTPNYNIKKPIIGYKEGLLIVVECESIRKMSRITGIHHARIESSLYFNKIINGWKFELI